MTNKTDILSRRAFLGMATTIAMPIMVQNLISTLVETADTIMLGYVSQDAMAASSLAGNVYMVLWMALNGFVTGAAVLGSQYWGKKDTETIERVLGLTVRFSMIVGLVFFVGAFFFPEVIMAAFSNDTAIINEGAVYLKILSFSYLFSAFSMAYFGVQRSIEVVLLPSIVFVASLCINVAMNATFIFGLFGAPKLGLVGVAIGTVSARVFEFLACAIHSLWNKQVKFRFKYVFAKTGVLMGDFLRISLPSLVNDVAWSLAASMYSVILGHMGSDAVAANAVANMVLSIGAIMSRGFSNATTIIVGKALGEDDVAKAKIYARRMVVITLVFSIIGGGVILGLKPLITNIYMDKLTKTAIKYLGVMLVMQSYHIIGEGLNTCWICGCFRGGGDTKFGMIVDCLSMWLVAVPLTAAAAFIFKLPVEGVYFVLCLDEFEKMLPVFIHYKKFNWLTNITRDASELA